MNNTKTGIQPPEVSYYLTKIIRMLGRDGFEGLGKEEFYKKDVRLAMSKDDLPEPLKSWGKRASDALDIIADGDHVIPPLYDQVSGFRGEIARERNPEKYDAQFNTTYYREYVGRKK